MKKIYIVLLLLIASVSLSLAQSTSTDYFMNTSQSRSMLNPAYRAKNGYIGIPSLANIYIDAKTNTLNLDHLVFDNNGQKVLFMHPSVSSSEFLNNMSANNYFALDTRFNILSTGFYTRKGGFWTIDMGVRIEGDLNIPKGLFEFMKKGFSTLEPDSDPIRYDLKNFGANLNAFGEIAVGNSRSFLDDNLLIGAKIKGLIGLGNFAMNFDKMNIEYGYDKWIVRSQASINMAGVTPKYDRSGVFDGIDDYVFEPAGFGLGFDLGGVYNLDHLSGNVDNDTFAEILSRTRVSLAFTDMGFISWSGSNSSRLATDEGEAVIDFNDLEFSEEGSLEDQIDDALDEFESFAKFRNTDKTGYTTSLRTNMNVGLEYEAWRNNLSVGLLSATKFGHNCTTSELTLSANYNPNRGWFATSLSYSFIHSAFSTIGWAIHLAPKKGMNLFLASDYIIPNVNNQFIPVKSRALNFQFGVSVPLGGPAN